MSDPRPSAVLTVPCPCPGTPHPDGDTVNFREHLSFDGGIAAATSAGRARREGLDEFDSAFERALGLTFVVHGVTSWTFVDAAGAALPITSAVVKGDALPWTTLYPIWDRATDLYAVEAFAPLVPRLPAPSLNGQTEPSTSATSGGRAKPRKRSGSSSPATSAGSRP